MITRRRLLGSTIGMGVGTPFFRAATAMSPLEVLPSASYQNTAPWTPQHEQILAGAHDLGLLGQPRSWSSVKDGFHPVAPERVVIVPRPSNLDGQASPFVVEQIHRPVQARLAAVQRTNELPKTKLCMILGIMKVLTSFYSCPTAHQLWAANCAYREALGSTGQGNGYALIHQFQDATDRSVEVVNSPLDWWLFLFPSGTEWDAYDEQPVRWMLAPVFARWDAVLALRAYSLAAQVAGMAHCDDIDASAWGSLLSQLDRIAAARTVNTQFARALV